MVQEPNPIMSPARISFSYDLRCSSDQPHAPPPRAAADFDFCVRRSCDHDSPSAAELFADGKIVPAEIKKKTQKPLEIQETTEKQSSNRNGRSFWGFKRSSSVTGYRLCPLPLLLSRSNSTGSGRAVKTTSVSGNNVQKPPLKKQSYGSGGGVVLNVPVVNIFGRASFFTNGRDRDHKGKIANK